MEREDRYTSAVTDSERVEDGPEDQVATCSPDGGPASALVAGSRAEIAEPPGFVDPKTSGLQDDGAIALLVKVQVPDQPGVLHALTRDLEALPIVRMVERQPSFGRIRGKRIIVIGGGAQVGQVMLVARTARFDIRRQRGYRY